MFYYKLVDSPEKLELAYLMRNIFSQSSTAIPKQLQQLNDTAIQFSLLFKHNRYASDQTRISDGKKNIIFQLLGRSQDIEQKKSEQEIVKSG